MISGLIIVALAVLPGVAGAFLAHRYSVFALVPMGLLIFVLALGGCVISGANFLASALTVLSGLTCMHLGYFFRILVPYGTQRLGEASSGANRVKQMRPQRPFRERKGVQTRIPSSLDW